MKGLLYWLEITSFEEAVTLKYDFVNPYKGFAADVLLNEPGVVGVCGHAIVPEVTIYRDHYIGIDTGCGFGKKLSAIELPTLKVYDVPEIFD